MDPFDLGQSEFIPVQFLRMDRKTPFPGRHYFFYVPERKNGFFPEVSTGFEPKLFEDQKHTGTISHGIKDGDISVYPLAAKGTDALHDDSLLWSLFFSDQAFSALHEAGLTDDFMAVRCSIVSSH